MANRKPTSIFSLPQELVDLIVYNLSISDMLSLGSTSKHFLDNMVCTKLYLHPTRLDDAVQLLSSQSAFAKRLRSRIEEVVVLGV